jgi:hypothetical protein
MIKVTLYPCVLPPKDTSTEADYKKHIRKLPIVYMLKSPCPVLIKTVKVVKNQRKAEKLSQPK